MAKDGKKVIEYMRSKGYRILALNIVYIEDVWLPDEWNPVPGKLDAWDDARCIIRNDGEILLCCAATTEPGRYYTENPMNERGAFRIAFGNYQDAWKVGLHHQQLALIQCGTITGYRDFNQDGKRTGDPVDVGDDFGINQHTTGDGNGYCPDVIGRWSGGCLTGQHSTTHYEKFMKICQGMGRRKFDTTIIASDELSQFGN